MDKDWRKGLLEDLAVLETRLFGDLFIRAQKLNLFDAGSALDAAFSRRDSSGLYRQAMCLAAVPAPPPSRDPPVRARELLTIVLSGFAWLSNSLRTGATKDWPGLSDVLPPARDREGLEEATRALEHAVSGCSAYLQAIADGSAVADTLPVSLMTEVLLFVRKLRNEEGLVVEPVGAAPQGTAPMLGTPPPLTTGQIAKSFQGIDGRASSKWLAVLGDVKNHHWLLPARATRGKAPKPSTWWPLVLAKLLQTRGVEQGDLNQAFLTESSLKPWLPAWQEARRERNAFGQ